MNIPSHFVLTMLSLALTPVMANTTEPLTILFDSGRTKPIAPLLKPLQRNVPNEDDEHLIPEPDDAWQFMFPVTSPGLSRGPVSERTLDRALTSNLFLIGTDPDSLQWLAQHQQNLKAAGAVGLVVVAHSAKDLKPLHALGTGLTLIPASGSQLAETLGIQHFPVAIIGRHVWQ